jgi:hypothetical protein
MSKTHTSPPPAGAFDAVARFQIDNLDAHDGLNETKGHIGCASSRRSAPSPGITPT